MSSIETARKNLIFGAVLFTLTLVMLLSSILAWFAFGVQPATQNSLVVMSTPPDMFEDIIKIYYVTDSGEVDGEGAPIYTRKEISETELDILPGEYLMFEIDLTNIGEEDIWYKLMFGTVTATYPNLDLIDDYAKYICDLYDAAGTMHFIDDLEEKEPETGGLSGNDLAKAVLEAVVQPVSNAMYFNYAKTRQTEGDLIDVFGNVKDEKMTLFGDKILVAGDPGYERFVEKKDKIVCRQVSPFNYPPKIETEEEWLAVPKGETITVYFSLYFAGTIGTSGSYGQTQYHMNNSNGFLAQQLKIMFNLLIKQEI